MLCGAVDECNEPGEKNLFDEQDEGRMKTGLHREIARMPGKNGNHR